MSEETEVVIRTTRLHTAEIKPDHVILSWPNDMTTNVVRLGGGANSERVGGNYSIDSSFIADINDIDLENDEEGESRRERRRRIRKILRWFKVTLLFCCWLVFTSFLMLYAVPDRETALVAVGPGFTAYIILGVKPTGYIVGIKLDGAFMPTQIEADKILAISLEEVNGTQVITLSNKPLYLRASHSSQDFKTMYHRFHLIKPCERSAEYQCRFSFKSFSNRVVTLQTVPYLETLSTFWAAVLSAALLVSMLILIIWRLVNLALAGVFATTLAIAMLAYWDVRPDLPMIVDWLTINTLLMIFSVSLLMTVVADTGALDYMVVWAYEISNGHIWPILNILLLIMLVSSCLLDPITMILFLTPLQIKLSEVLDLDPAPVLMFLCIAANIGRTLRPPPGVIEAADPDMGTTKAILFEIHISFWEFISHMFPIVFIIVCATYAHLRLLFSDSSHMRFRGLAQAQRLRRLIRHWRHTANMMTSYSKDERIIHDTVMTKARNMRDRVRRLGRMPQRPPDFDVILKQLKSIYYIKNRDLAYKCLIVLIAMLVLVFVNELKLPVPFNGKLPIGWIMLLCAILLFILADIEELEGMMARTDWTTLLFLAALDILMRCFLYLGLYDAIIECAQNIVEACRPEWRLSAALLTTLWISGLMSALMVSVPIVTDKSFTIKIIYHLIDVDATLPLNPMLWAMFLGITLGSNGTVIGSVLNIVVAGTAEKHGYDFSFWYFFKIGFPIVLQNLTIASIYLLVCHVLYDWH